MSEKDQLMQNINASIPIAQQMVQVENEIAQIEEKIEKKKKFWGGMKIVAIIAAVIFVLGILMIASGTKFDISILFPIPFIVIYILHLIIMNKVKKQIEPLNQKLTALRAEPSLAWLPDKYRDGGCIYKIAEYVNNGRADSMKAALDLLEEDIHRQQMEEAAMVGAYLGAQSRR